MNVLAQTAAVAAITYIASSSVSLGCHMGAEKMAEKKCEKNGIDPYSEEGYDLKAKYTKGANVISALATSGIGVAASYGIWQLNHQDQQQPVVTETVETEDGGTVEVTTF